jgi:hypothetical protein
MSARDLPIYVTQAAPAPLAGWLQRLLLPVATACCFDRAVPIEIRPTGVWGGWCASRDGASDRRVSLTSKIVFYKPESILSLYIHECGHRFLEHAEVMNHGAEFFCLNLVLLLRAQPLFKRDAAESMSLYDLQDAPAALDSEPGWRGIVLHWALPVAAELAVTDASAEALASVVCARWEAYIQEREQSRAAAAQQSLGARKFAAAQKEKVEALKSSLFFARTFLFVGRAALLSVVYFVFQ